MYLLKKDMKFPKDNFKSMKFMPYSMKRSFSLYRVKEWNDYWDVMSMMGNILKANHQESEPNRFQRLAVSDNDVHRKMYEWGMQITNNGVTYQEALEHCNIPTKTWKSVGQMEFTFDGKEQ